MYVGALILLLGTPIALGSWWGVLMFIPIGLVANLWSLFPDLYSIECFTPGAPSRYRLQFVINSPATTCPTEYAASSEGR